MPLAKRSLAILRLYQSVNSYRGPSRGLGIPMCRRLFAVLTRSAFPKQGYVEFTRVPTAKNALRRICGVLAFPLPGPTGNAAGNCTYGKATFNGALGVGLQPIVSSSRITTKAALWPAGRRSQR